MKNSDNPPISGPNSDPLSQRSNETLAQEAESINRSEKLSIPKEVQQHPTAPKIPGYILVNYLGKGAYAEVWKAWQLKTHKWVAIKAFTKRKGVNWLFLQREIERLVKLDKHPHIVTLLDVDLDSEPPYYVMDLLEGGSLDQFVNTGKIAPAGKAVQWMEEIAETLVYVHSKGLIHCDLKPANILIDEAGHVRVADFGQSRVIGESAGSLGTLFYMAPEQAVTAEEGETVQPDVRWDIYGLGATIWAILSGKTPHEERNIEKLQRAKSIDEKLIIYRGITSQFPLADLRDLTSKNVDGDLSAIVEKCASAELSARYESARGVIDDLTARKHLKPVSPLAHNKGYRFRRFIRRNAAMVALASAAFIALSLTVAGILRQSVMLKKQLAYSYVLRGQYFSKEGYPEMAALYYAQSNSIYRTHLALANALSVNWRADKIMAARGPVISVAYSPDGKRVLTGSMDKTARLWDVATGEPIGRAMRHDTMVVIVSYSPDGKSVATVSLDGAARLWKADTGEQIGKALRLGKEVIAVAFSPDGESLLTGSRDKTARLWDAGTGEPIGRVMRHEGLVTAVAYSPDGKRVLTGSDDTTARLWDAGSGAPIGRLTPNPGQVSAAVFSPDGSLILTGSSNKTAQLWDADTGKAFGIPMRHEGAVQAVAFSPDGKSVITGSEDNTARLWTVPKEPVGIIMRHEGAVSAVAFSPDGKTILTAGKDKTARLWDIHTHMPIGKIMRHKGAVSAVVFSPDGKTILTTSEDKTVRLWDAVSGDPIGKVMRHDDMVERAVFSPDGKRVLTGSRDKTARLWDAGTGEPVGKTMSHEAEISAVAFSPDGKRVLTGSGDKTARLWDARTGEPAGKVMQCEDSVFAVAFSPDGRRVLTGSREKGARLWDAGTGEQIGKAMLHEALISVSFSPDGRTILTAGRDNTARLWDTDTGELIGGPIPHKGSGRAAVFDRNGRNILTGSDSGIVQLQNVAWLNKRIADDNLLLEAEVFSLRRINSAGYDERIPFKEWNLLYRRWKNRKI